MIEGLAERFGEAPQPVGDSLDELRLHGEGQVLGELGSDDPHRARTDAKTQRWVFRDTGLEDGYCKFLEMMFDFKEGPGLVPRADTSAHLACNLPSEVAPR